MKNEDNHRLIAFLEACYKSDNREQLLYNYQGNTVEHKKMLTDTELLTGDLAFLPLTANYGEKLALELSSYRFEKALYLLPFFLTGGKTTDGKTVCAPLFFIPANLAFEDEMYKIYPEFENTQVNPAFFRLIEATDEDDVSSIAEMLNLLNGDALTFEKVAKMQRLLQKRYPALHSNDMLLYPNLASKIQSTGAAQLKVVSCCGMGILRKSSHTVHVQKELESLVQSKFLSPPLRQFLQLDKGSEKPLDKDELKLVPAMLNKAQLNAIDHAKKYSSSVVIGPPGTGKSYTIAAMAVEAAMQGKSVLITSAKNQAVDVVKHKIENDFGIQDLCMRAGGKGDYKADFKRRFENLLNGIGIEMVDQNELQSLMSDLNKTNKRIAQLEREYEKAGIQAIKLGKRLQRNTKGLWAYIAAKTSKWAMNKYAPMWQTLPELEALYPEKLELLKKIIQLRFKHNVFLTMRKRRNMVKVFAAALRARTIQTKEARFSQVDFSQLKTAFPIWLVNLSECANVLPLSQGFFDLVIIDEASQCDIATALPLLQRAQSVVVCGDPKQLRHVSFMNEQKMRHLAQKNGLTALELETYNYRQKSVLDTFIEIIEKQEAITLLNEHFRSKPELIAFSNREFYENKLRVMTSNPYQSQGKALHFHKIEGQRINGINSEETRFVVDAVEKIRAINEKSPVAVQRSVGVLSPFRDQVNHMQQQLWERLGPAGFNQLQLLVGTAHSFQGEERDVMFISLSVDDEAHATALRHVNQLEVFNVSVTRARSEQHVVYSISPTNLAPKTLLNRYLSQSFVPAQEAVPNHRYDKFLNEVMALLNQLGYQQLYVNHSIAGVTFDLVVVATQGLLAIDLVGYSKQFEEAVQLERIQVFRRTGHKVFPIAYTDWIYRKQEVSNALNALL